MGSSDRHQQHDMYSARAMRERQAEISKAQRNVYAEQDEPVREPSDAEKRNIITNG